MAEMKKRNFAVFAAGSVTSKEIAKKMEKQGIRFVNIPLKRGPDFLGGDLIYFLRVFFLCRREKFYLCHNFTIKPCIYAVLAQRLAGIKNIYCTVTGLGSAFSCAGSCRIKNYLSLKSIAVRLYKFSLKHAKIIIFQNPEDRKTFINLNIVREEKSALVKSSGVDTKEFSLQNIRREAQEKISKEINYNKDKIVISLISRMLWQKGVGEFVKAAEELRWKPLNLEFLLVGPVDRENPSGIAEKKIKEWEGKGFVKYLKNRDEIREILALSNIVVLPSYYKEGIPKILLEAGAMERPLIAADVPGCREAVRNNENGFLVNPRDSKDLAEKMEILIKNKDLREKFGKRSREIVEKDFNVEKVVRETIERYNL